MFAKIPAPSVPTPYQDDSWQHIGIPVDSHPASAGRLGHHDLAAGLSEYVRDAVPRSVPTPATGGLIELGGDEIINRALFSRTIAYNSWRLPHIELTFTAGFNIGYGTDGFRCARDL